MFRTSRKKTSYKNWEREEEKRQYSDLLALVSLTEAFVGKNDDLLDTETGRAKKADRF